MIIVALLLATALPGSNCYPVASDRIYARDIAAAVPGFSNLPPDAQIGFAPAPGQQRRFRATELQRIAQTAGIKLNVKEDACFAWDLAVPTPSDIVAAMRKSLEHRNAQLDIVDQSMMPAPKGEFVFPLSGLCGVSNAPLVWRGYVSYANDKRFAIWARVRVVVREQRVVAADNLLVGVPIRADQVRLETHEGPASPEKTFEDIGRVVGLLPRFPLSAGAVLTGNLLETGKDVQRGDLVEVIVEAEGARIEAQGIAQDSGARGAVISIRNTRSGRNFRARVEGKDKVVVIPHGFSALVSDEKKS